MPEVHDRRLREAADDLVGARDHEVGAQRERVRGQVVVEGEVRAPGLVDDQRHAVGVGRPRPARPRRPPRRSRWATRPSRRPRPASRRARDRAPRASGSGRCPARGRPPARRRSGAAPPGCSRRWCSSARCAGPRPVAGVGEREQRHVVALRGAVDEEPGAPRAPGLGGELLGLLERRRLRRRRRCPTSSAGMSSASAPLADRLAQPRVGAGAALVAGHVQAARGRGRRRRAARRGTGCRDWSRRVRGESRTAPALDGRLGRRPAGATPVDAPTCRAR